MLHFSEGIYGSLSSPEPKYCSETNVMWAMHLLPNIFKREKFILKLILFYGALAGYTHFTGFSAKNCKFNHEKVIFRSIWPSHHLHYVILGKKLNKKTLS